MLIACTDRAVSLHPQVARSALLHASCHCLCMSYEFHQVLSRTMSAKRKALDADDKISQSSPVKRKPASAKVVSFTGKDIAQGSTPHFRDFVGQMEPDYKIAIPSHDRSEKLCTGTLALLRRHGVDMQRVYVFVAPFDTTSDDTPQWFAYLEALRRHDLLSVHLCPGAIGLAAQLNCIWGWATRGYVIVMTDDILDVRERYMPASSAAARLEPLAAGVLKAVFAHAYALLLAGGFTAWSLNPSVNVEHMSESAISVKLGLLEGNITGYLLADDASEFFLKRDVGVVADLATSLQLWSTGKRFVRYRSLCVQHRYRGRGGYESVMTKEERRDSEDEHIRALVRKFPDLIRYCPKPNASYNQQQYKFTKVGEPPLVMRDPMPTRMGRPYSGVAD